MTGPQGMGQLVPTVLLSSGDSLYDQYIENEVGTVWSSKLGAMDAPVWIPYNTAVLQNEYNTGRGPLWVEAWTNEYDEMEWPSYIDGIDDNASQWLGPYWTNAWWDQSVQSPYDTVMEFDVESIWYNLFDEEADALAYGGVISTAGGYRYHTFTTNLEWAFHQGTDDVTIEGILVGGGGGGGGNGFGILNNGGGGGGAAEIFSGITPSGTSPVVIGAGGGGNANGRGATGGNSTFAGMTALGGGGGGGGGSGSSTQGGDGGSGGGAAATNDNTSQIGGTGSPGFNGGDNAIHATLISRRGGGGGGAGSAGAAGIAGSSSTTSGQGGDGVQWPAGSGTYYGGGGGGNPGNGGLGGGANGGNNSAPANTGGGGGSGVNGGAGSGGSGILIIRYPL